MASVHHEIEREEDVIINNLSAFLPSPKNLKGQCHKIFASDFYYESFSPKPCTENTLGSIRIFSKIRGDIRKSRCTTGINDTGSK
jgi:hypothetical protein